MDVTSSPRPSRRSFPNLTHLSLAPLSSRFPIDDELPVESLAGAEDFRPRSSYIQTKSTPATPGILSRSNSRVRNHRRKRTAGYAYDGSHTWRAAADDLAQTHKAKSTSSLLSAPRTSNRHKTPRSPLSTIPPNEDEWLHRAGLVIASEARDAKGQSWLATRSSSTSLVKQGDDDGLDRYMSQRSQVTIYAADDEYSPVTPRYPSRTPSARQSRRGSKVGSRPELRSLADLRLLTPGNVGRADYFDAVSSGGSDEPDFVDAEETDSGAEDEEEVNRLTRERSFGLGGWVDKLVNWTLFEEDGEASESEDETLRKEIEDKRRKEIERRREAEQQRMRERVAELHRKKEETAKEEPGSSKVDETETGEQEGGWQDAAWLLSVASKVLL